MARRWREKADHRRETQHDRKQEKQGKRERAKRERFPWRKRQRPQSKAGYDRPEIDLPGSKAGFCAPIGMSLHQLRHGPANKDAPVCTRHKVDKLLTGDEFQALSLLAKLEGKREERLHRGCLPVERDHILSRSGKRDGLFQQHPSPVRSGWQMQSAGRAAIRKRKLPGKMLIDVSGSVDSRRDSGLDEPDACLPGLRLELPDDLWRTTKGAENGALEIRC